MNDLLALQTALTSAMTVDPVLCLAQAVAWLDPMWNLSDEIDMPQDEDDTLFIALHIVRRAFPDIYLDALQTMRQGVSYVQLDHLICDGIRAHGIPLDSIEWIGYGIPLPAYGAVLDDPDFYTQHPDVVSVLAYFGISPEPNPYNIQVPDVAYTAAEIIATDLMQHSEEGWHQVAWLIRWLFSNTNNSCIDWDIETMNEVQPLSWEPVDIAFAQEIIEEADGIMADAMAGLAFINKQPDAMAVLQNNVRCIYEALEKQKRQEPELAIQLAWSL